VFKNTENGKFTRDRWLTVKLSTFVCYLFGDFSWGKEPVLPVLYWHWNFCDQTISLKLPKWWVQQ